jgi:hypothetical protein
MIDEIVNTLPAGTKFVDTDGDKAVYLETSSKPSDTGVDGCTRYIYSAFYKQQWLIISSVRWPVAKLGW